MRFDKLKKKERLALMRFLCSFAWADGTIQAQERAVLMSILEHLELGPKARAEVDAWLKAPPDMDGFDFTDIPTKKRDLFLDLAFAVVSSDGELAPEELKQLSMFQAFRALP